MPSVSEQASALENHVKQLEAQIDVINSSVSPTKASQLYVHNLFVFFTSLFYDSIRRYSYNHCVCVSDFSSYRFFFLTNDSHKKNDIARFAD